jgi:hypothetical protein
MARVLKDRTDNDIKNKIYSMIRSGKMQKRAKQDAGIVTQSSAPGVASSQNPPQNEIQALEFPPSFSLVPIEAYPISNGAAILPSNEQEQTTGESLDFTFLWEDVKL